MILALALATNSQPFRDSQPCPECVQLAWFPHGTPSGGGGGSASFDFSQATNSQYVITMPWG